MGSGYRVFTAGEVLTASNVQDYLMDQSVMSFADSTARATGIGTANFEEGMLSYLQDTNQLEVYNGTSWASIAPTTTQGLTLINTTSFSGVTSFSLAQDTFTSTYDNYKVVVNLDTFTNQHTITGRMRLAGTDNSTSNYRFGLQIRDYSGNEDWTNSNGGTLWTFSRFLTTYTHYGFSVDVFNPKRAVPTTYTTQGFAYVTVDGSISGSGHLNLSTAFDSMSFIATAGTITGSYSVYGYNK